MPDVQVQRERSPVLVEFGVYHPTGTWLSSDVSNFFICCLAVCIELNLHPSPISYFSESYGWGVNIQMSKSCIFYWPVFSWSKLRTNSGCVSSFSSTAWCHNSNRIGASPLWVISYPSIQKWRGVSCASPEKDEAYFPLWHGSPCSFLQTGVQEHCKR